MCRSHFWRGENRILGASECYDLAVIELDGDGYQALEFSDEEPRTGLQIYAAGYPAPDEVSFESTDYTLTSGIISSTAADGESSWASIDDVLEHDAQILGGNSGGPLVDAAGRIIGVNYAVDDRRAAEEIFPIAEERGIGVLVYLPFGRSRLWNRVGDRAVPGWAGEIGIKSWGQFFIKFAAAHPAVTVVTPATSKPHHMLDNLGAAERHLGRAIELGHRPTQDFVKALEKAQQKKARQQNLSTRRMLTT